MSRIILMLSVLISSCNTQIVFEGKWLGYGYTCNGFDHPPETVEIFEFDNLIFAYKLVGDACVGGGEMTICFDKDNYLKGIVKSSRPSSSSYKLSKIYVKVINKDSFCVYLARDNSNILNFSRINSD